MRLNPGSAGWEIGDLPADAERSREARASLFHGQAQDVGEHLDRRLVGVDFMHEVPAVKLEQGLGFLS